MPFINHNQNNTTQIFSTITPNDEKSQLATSRTNCKLKMAILDNQSHGSLFVICNEQSKCIVAWRQLNDIHLVLKICGNSVCHGNTINVYFLINTQTCNNHSMDWLSVIAVNKQQNTNIKSILITFVVNKSGTSF